MTTKQEIIFSLMNTIRGGSQSNNEPISENQVSWEFDNVRAKFIRQDLNKKRSINPDLIQTLCIDLVIADASDCPCEIAGCTILKSTRQIPPAIELEHRNLIVSVGPIDLTKRRFNFLPYNRAIWYNPNKFSQNIPGAFIHNSYLYVVATGNKVDMLEVCTMQIVLERPEDASVFTCTGTPCYTVNSKYPISAAMIEDCKAFLIQNNLKIAATAPSDPIGDGAHSLESPIEK
jgi:hypothetical protein